MKKLARGITKCNKLILIIMLALAVVGAFLITKVEINSDMTKYLANDSSMKIGTDLMNEELESAETDQTIKVMFNGLSDSERLDMAEDLSYLPYVDSVDYEADSEDYNNGTYSLFVIHTEYDYDSTEERSIEKTLKKDFSDYDMVYENEDSSKVNLPMKIIAAALVIAFIILIIMSNSWVEPILLVITIGVAILINMGSNIFLGSVSNITFSIAAILQIVLSMDYSIILMNRYRQEFARLGEKKSAMESALTMAFPSVASSGFTTVVGLLMLVFMRFKIGMDLGIVLAKGVLISMICTFTALPGLILLMHGVIQKTDKRSLDIPLFKMSGGMYKARKIFIPLLCIVFVLVCVGQTQSTVSYSFDMDDAITDIFPEDNSIVMLVSNEDEDKIEALCDAFSDNEYVKSTSSYPTILGKEYTSDDMVDNISSLSDDVDITPEMLSILYYDYFAGDEIPELTASEFILFVNDYVVNADAFSGYMGDDIADNIGMMLKFADADTLAEPMTAEELADFFDMDEDDMLSILLLYNIENGDEDAGTMTMPVFADFVVNELAEDEDYADMFDEETLDEMQTLLAYTDEEEMTKARSCEDMAEFFGMDESDMQLLYVYYYALDNAYSPEKMTVSEFINYLCDDIANDATFSSYFDAATLSQMKALLTYTDKTKAQTQMSAASLASFFGMDESQVKSIMLLYYTKNGGVSYGTMTLPTFTDFLLNDVANDPTYGAMFDASTLAQIQTLSGYTDVTAMTTPVDYATMAGMLGMDEGSMAQVYSYYATMNGDETGGVGLTLSAQTVIGFLVENGDMFGIDAQQQASLATGKQMIDASVAGTAFTPAQLASTVGMDESQLDTLFLLYISEHGDTSSWKLSPQTFLNFVISDVASDSAYSGMFDASTLSQLKTVQSLMNASINGTAYSYSQMASTLGMDRSTAKLLFVYHEAATGSAEWTMSVQETVNFIMENEDTFSSMMGDEISSLEMAQEIINGSIDGTEYSAEELAELLGMNEEQISQLYLLYVSEYGDADWTLSVQDFVEFVRGDVMTDPDYADLISSDVSDELDSAQTLIDAVISGDLYTAQELADMFSGLSEDLDENTMELLYLYYAATFDSDPSWTMTLRELINFMADDIAHDSRFDSMLGADMKLDLDEMRDSLEDGIRQMKGDNYQIVLFTTTFPEESADTTAFLENLSAYADIHLSGDYYLIGESPMVREMQESFKSELTLITWLTIISIFVVVAVTFRSLVIPLILVVIVQCGVYLTMTACGIFGYSIYYLALLIVQCILMGATIDYGILFTNYYREYRLVMGRRDALRDAYRGASHTIFTSGLIMILVTFIIGISPADPTISQICLVISIGVLSAVVLIVLILPGILTTLDRFIAKKNSLKE